MGDGFARAVKWREYLRRRGWPAGLACPNHGMAGESFEMIEATDSLPRLRVRDGVDGVMASFADRW
jgi:hypothetical protein